MVASGTVERKDVAQASPSVEERGEASSNTPSALNELGYICREEASLSNRRCLSQKSRRE